MKKAVQIISIALVAMSIGCKPGNNTTTTDVVAANILVNKTVDINQMYQFYYNDPQTLDERQENDIIDYIIDKNLIEALSIARK